MNTNKNKKLNFIIPLIIYPSSIMFSMNESDVEVYLKLKKMGVNMHDSSLNKFSETQKQTEEARTIMFPDGQVLIRMYSGKNGIYWFSCLQHEIFHAVDFVLMRIGIELCRQSSEAYAYLVGYLTYEIYKKIGL